MDTLSLGLKLTAWLAAVGVLLLVRRQRGLEGSGLLYSYILNLWTIHWLGAFIYLLPWSRFGDPAVVVAGFEQSLYGVAAFVLGSLVLAPVFGLRRAPSPGPGPASPAGGGIAAYYLATGALAYVALSQVRLPTLDAVVSAGQQLLVAGLCLECWQAWRSGRTSRLVGWLAVTLGLPVFTIVHSGYLSYGAVAALVVFVFVGSFFRPRRQVAVVALVVAYAGLSFYVSYMRDRGDIRERVWGGKPIDERIEQVLETVSQIEPFDPFNEQHLRAIDDRLNQNFFVGLAIDRLKWAGDFAYGDTIWQGLLTLVPRAVWPDKPTGAGSGDLVSQYTGLRFGPDTSVGIGAVMEFYVNFGTTGVIVGFALVGALMTLLDSAAHRRLVRGDWPRFALVYLVGMSFLQVGGSLVDVAGVAGGSVAAVALVNRAHRLVLARRRVAGPVDRRRPVAARPS